MLITIVLLNTSLWGQEKKNSLTVGVIAASFISVEDREFEGDRYPGYYRCPSPGIELVYMRAISEGFELGTGINYQLGFVSSYINYHERRFKFNDICFPLLFKKYFKIRDYDHLYVTTGIYFGRTKNIKIEYPVSSGWIPWPYYSTVENYSDDVRYSDLYVDLGYHTSSKKTFTFSFAPFFKYRINPTWLNYHQNKFHFGIKLNYSLNF
jgi:hypothetical protein